MTSRPHPWVSAPPKTHLPVPKPSTGAIKVWHFYHVFADGWWPPAVYEHLLAIKRSGLPLDYVCIGIVGRDHERVRVVRQYLASELGDAEFVTADEGFEQVTIQAMAARLTGGPIAVLYAHDKGSYHSDEPATLWRRSMTHHLVCHWRRCLDLLADNYDAAGCHWKEPERYFAGNCWWANATYLATLPPVGMRDRGDAETWIGRGNPQVYDLRPGWPHPELFGDMHDHVSCP